MKGNTNLYQPPGNNNNKSNIQKHQTSKIQNQSKIEIEIKTRVTQMPRHHHAHHETSTNPHLMVIWVHLMVIWVHPMVI